MVESSMPARVLTRRRLLRSAAVTSAGLSVLAACSSNGSPTGASTPTGTPGAPQPASPKATTTSSSGRSTKGSSRTPLPPPKTLRESPQLAAKVKAGKLPALHDRLPEDPYVIPHHWCTRGEYGGDLKMSMSDTGSSAMYEYNYGNSFVRYLNDGLDIGPGLAKSWQVNADSTQFTFHFRRGLKWSDGKPWTTADVMYWWEDMVLDPRHTAAPPDDTRDGRDAVATVTAVDDYTLRLTFKSPAPAAVERIAAWVNGNNGSNGAVWVVPRHYIKQFHPKYNHKIDPDSNWQVKHDQKLLWLRNPDCPTLVGWHCAEYHDGRSVVLERNPYYYAVSAQGDQLPYIDRIQWTCTQDPQVQLLQFTTSKVDYVHGGHTALTLADFSTLKKAEASGTGLHVRTWDSGSGTGSVTFLNFDSPDKKWRTLLAEQKFRLALSHAFNRPEARKVIYFQTGELTTGTLSTKGPLFNATAKGKRYYKQWRDAADQYDPKLSAKLLDELGVKDRDGDGMREYPDGSKLTIRLDYPADTSNEHKSKCIQLARDWTAVGCKTVVNPMPPAAYGDGWGRGQLTAYTAWESSDSNVLVYPNFVIPIQTAGWAPLTGQGYAMRLSAPDELRKQADVNPWKRKPPFVTKADGLPMADELARLQDTYDRARVEPDPAKRANIIWQIIKQHIDKGPYFLGVVCNYPQPVLTHPDLRNVPDRDQLALGGWVNPWVTPSPAVYDPEVYYWHDPGQHEI